MVIEFPKAFKINSFHTVWTDINNLRKLQPSEREAVLLDLSNVGYIDAQGLNYLILIPFILKRMGFECSFVLPLNDRVLEFMEWMGVMRHLEENFNMRGRERSHPPRYARQTQIFKAHRFFVRHVSGTHVFHPNALCIPDIVKLIRKNEHFPFIQSVQYLAKSFSFVLYELLTNIFQHSEETTGCLTIQFRSSNTNDKLAGKLFVAVSDLGIGISKSMREHSAAEVTARISKFDDMQILAYACLPEVSRTGLRARGQGLDIITRTANITRISSGEGTFHVDVEKGIRKTQSTAYVPGTSVSVIFNAQR